MAGNIRSYEAPQNLGLNPTETGIDALTQGARRIGTFGQQIASTYDQEGSELKGAVANSGQVAVDYMDHQQINDGAAKGAQLMASLNQQWEDTAKQINLNDPDAQQKLPAIKQQFLEEKLEPALEQFQQGFSTEKSQDWADHFVAQYRNHMFEKTTATTSALAGEAVKVNVAKTVNGLASAVAIDPSTHSIDNALDVLDHSVGAMVDSSPNIDAGTGAGIKGAVAQSAKEQIVKSAVASMITKNPNIDLTAIQQKYADYLKPGEMQQFQKAAQVQAKSNALVDKQTQVAQRQLDEQKVHAGATKVLTDNVTFDQTTGKPIVDPKFFSQALDIAKNNPSAPNAASTVQTMFNWGEGQQNKTDKPIDDPLVKSDLTTRMFSADKPTTVLDLMKARAEGKISDHTFEAMHGLVAELAQSPLKGPVWDDTIEAVKSELVLSNVGLPGKDIAGEGNYAKWAQTFIPKYLSMQRAGTLPPNALDVKDPTSLISQSMAPFKRTVQQRAQDYLSVLGVGDSAPGASTRKVGDVPVPAALGGVASLQYNKATKQWRDQTSGTVYDSAGAPVAR